MITVDLSVVFSTYSPHNVDKKQVLHVFCNSTFSNFEFPYFLSSLNYAKQGWLSATLFLFLKAHPGFNYI